MMIDLGLLAAGCALLYLGARSLIGGAVQLGSRFRLSGMMTGLFIVAIGTSLPELAVAVDAAMHGHGVVAVGTTIGSNIVNVTLVLGAAALIGRMPVGRELRRWDMPCLVAITLLVVFALADERLGRVEGALLVAGILVLLVYRLRQSPTVAAAEPIPDEGGLWRAVGALAVGVVMLVCGAEAMVASGIGLARTLGVPEAVIALSVTAVGTGIPEIAATLVAVSRGNQELALGNIVGSNLLNLGIVLGLSSLVAPMTTVGLGWLPLIMMAAATLALWLLVTQFAALQRWTGLLLLSFFGIYQVVLIG